MSRTNQLYSLPEIISFLENRNFDKFRFADDYAYIYNSDGIEIVLEAVDEKITDEVADLAMNALNHLDRCMESAQGLLNRMKGECSGERMVYGICFEHYGYGHETRTSHELGFTISFHYEYDNRIHTVKFNAHTFMHGAFAIEEWIQ